VLHPRPSENLAERVDSVRLWPEPERDLTVERRAMRTLGEADDVGRREHELAVNTLH
jgi:hypothetical protein